MKTLKLIQTDTYLRPYAEAIEGRHKYALHREKELTGGSKLSEWANGYMYFGLHKVQVKSRCKTAKMQWVLREWAPNATKIYLIGEFNNWQEDEAYAMKRLPKSGNWEITASNLPKMAYGKSPCQKKPSSMNSYTNCS